MIAAIIIIVIIIGVIYQMVLFRRESAKDVIESLMDGVEKSISVSSGSFKDGGYIPRKYTCDGQDISPSLHWENIPVNTESIMILVYDPDAPIGYFIHWVIYNIPTHISTLDEGESGGGKVSSLGVETVNDFGRLGYGGPCPPPGKPHRYIFVVFALDTLLPSKESKVKSLDILKEARGHILAYGSIMGLYGR